MVVEFIGGSLRRDPPPLIERFIKDTNSIERAAVVAWWDSRALSSSLVVLSLVSQIEKGKNLPFRLLTS